MKDYTGKWSLSTCEERWDFDEVYDTREVAVAEVKAFCLEYGCDYAYIGQARLLTYDGLLDVWDIEQLAERMNEHDDVAGCDYGPAETTPTQSEQLRDVVANWMNENLDPITYHVVEEIQRVTP